MHALMLKNKMKPVMKSSDNKIAYENKLLKAYDAQLEHFEKRKVANLEHQNKVTKESVEKIKAEEAAEDQKEQKIDVMYVRPEPKFLVAIQIKSQNGVAPKMKKTLQLLRLKKINNCVILKNNQCIRKMLQIAKDSVAYGYISYDMLRELVYKRGHGKMDKSTVKLTNEAIETAFKGKYRCIEELLEVIYRGGDDMKKVLNFLVPLKLNSPKGKYCYKKRKCQTFVQGGVANNHFELLGELLSKMI